MEKRIVGFMNSVSASGNPGVTIGLQGDFTEWEIENRDCYGVRVDAVYLSGRHLDINDIGKEVLTFYQKDKDGNKYCSGIKFV